MKTEAFSFDRDSHLYAAASRVTDGTTNGQFVDGTISLQGRVPRGADAATVPVEPAACAAALEGPSLNHFNRAILFAQRVDSGSGTWLLSALEVRRSGGDWATPQGFSALTIPASPGLAWDVLDPFWDRLMLTGGSLDSEVLQCRFGVTPGSADAVGVSVGLLIVPGGPAGPRDQLGRLS